MSKSMNILFYIEKPDATGKKHYSVASYSNTTRMITYSSDYFFNAKDKK